MLVQVHSLRIIFSANPEPRAMAKDAFRSRPLKILLRSYIMVSFSSFRLSFCDKDVIYNQCRLLTNDKEITIWPSCELESLLNEFAKLTMNAVSRGITCVLGRSMWVPNFCIIKRNRVRFFYRVDRDTFIRLDPCR